MYILDLEADEWLEGGIQSSESEILPAPRYKYKLLCTLVISTLIISTFPIISTPILP